MKVRTSELIGPALDWAVAKCEGLTLHKDAMLNGAVMEGWYATGYYMDANQWIRLGQLRYSSNWAQGGLIIEREKISTNHDCGFSEGWCANVGFDPESGESAAQADGPAPLIAAMRCYVASKMGDEIEVPDELCKEIGK